MRVSHSLDRVLAAAEAQRDRIVEMTSQLLAIESIRPEPPGGEDPMGDGCRECLALAVELCRERGMEVRIHEGQVAVAEMGSGPENVALVVHMDTVPAGEGWTHPPFGGAVVHGEVWGRGAQDDKGPLASILGAIDALIAEGAPLRRRITVIIGTDEETGAWRDLQAFHAAEPMPTMSIITDADFPIINAEKGFANIVIETPKVEGAGEAQLLEFTAGQRINIVPDAARALVAGISAEWLEQRARAFCLSRPEARITVEPMGAAALVTAAGTPTHASTPANGHSALLDLAEFLAPEPFAPSAAERALRFVDQLLGQDLHGERLGVFAHDPRMGLCTCSAGKVDATPDGAARVWLNLRPVWGQTIDGVHRAIQAAAQALGERLGAEYVVTKDDTCREPLYVSDDSELVRGLRAAYERVTGQPATCESIGGTTFAKAFDNAVVFGPCAPDEPGLAHERDERVSIEALVRNAKLYAAALWELAVDGEGAG